MHHSQEVGKPPRLPVWSYEGAASVFVTCVTHGRHRAFEDREVCEFALSELFDKCGGRVEVTAHCLMPDHGHFLLTATRYGSSIPVVIRGWKQRTGYWYSMTRKRRLWQGNYWDHLLRHPLAHPAGAARPVLPSGRFQLNTNELFSAPG